MIEANLDQGRLILSVTSPLNYRVAGIFGSFQVQQKSVPTAPIKHYLHISYVN